MSLIEAAGLAGTAMILLHAITTRDMVFILHQTANLTAIIVNIALAKICR